MEPPIVVTTVIPLELVVVIMTVKLVEELPGDGAEVTVGPKVSVLPPVTVVIVWPFEFVVVIVNPLTC